MPFVLDASIALSWYLPGQRSSYAEAIYRRLNAGAEPAAAPLLWRTEIAAEQRKQRKASSVRGPA